MTVIRHCNLETTRKMSEHLSLAPRYESMFTGTRCSVEGPLMQLEKEAPMTNAQVYNILKAYQTEMILYMMICTTSKRAKKRISNYHTQMRNVTISISGKDLLSIGLSPGPICGQTLQAILEAKLNGKVKTREDEFTFATHLIKLTRGYSK